MGSGKGGVGKSTVTLNLALAFAEAGESVGIVDADVYGPDIPLMVNLKRTTSPEHWSLASTTPTRLEPVEEYGVKIMSTGFVVAEDHPVTWASQLVHRMLWQFVHETDWGVLDWLFIDLPPGTADLQQNLLSAVDVSGALVIVTPQDVAHLDAKKLLAMYARADVRVLGGVENMNGLACPHCDERIELFPRVPEDRSIWSSGVERLGEIPMDPAVSFGGDRGKPVMVSAPDGAAAGAFRALAQRVARALAS